MKRTLFTILIALFLLPVAIQAQMELPALSPKAKVEQRVGLTDITIEYSSPAVKGRTIWGALVPYSEVWRMGANQSTKVTFSKDVKIGGKDLKAGTYSLGAIPGQNEWTVIFSKKEEMGGWGSYDQAADDALRIQVKPQTIPNRERLIFIISDFSNESARIDMEWEKIRIPINVEFKTNEETMANIESTLNPTWRNYAAAARYVLDMGKKEDMAKALTWINRSVEIEQHWYNTWIQAQVLKAQGKNKEAYAAAQRAHELGQKDDNFFFKGPVEQALKDWKAK